MINTSITKHKPVGHQYLVTASIDHAADQHVHLSPHFALAQPAAGLPAKVDLRPLCSPVENQGNLSSCSGQAFAGAIEFLENSRNEFETKAGTFFQVSRLFVYYNERILERTTTKDAGAVLKDGIAALSIYGICEEALWPYDVSKFATAPAPHAYADALTRKVTQSARVMTQEISNVKQVLASNYPIVIGIQLFASFESNSVAASGVVNMPKIGEKCLGGHAVLIVGYDDATERVTVRNSWGPEWGQGGYFTLPYAYITNASLASDAWVIKT